MSPMPINHPILLFTRRIGDFLFSPAGIAGIVLFAIVLFGCAYTVDQTEQVVITQFGRPVGNPINAVDSSAGAGLHFKIPFVQTANRFEKRILEWDGQPSEMNFMLWSTHLAAGELPTPCDIFKACVMNAVHYHDLMTSLAVKPEM